MRITVIGTGYVGLVTGTCFAESGNDVICVDIDAEKVARLREGISPIYEPGLSELLVRNIKEGRLQFTTDLTEGMTDSALVFIAVGTPQGDDGAANLNALWAVTDQIRETATEPKIVVVKSTVPVGTNAKVLARLNKESKHVHRAASNPEFLKEGYAIEDFMKPDRVVVGVREPEVAKVLEELHRPFLRTNHPFLSMTPESSEMTKYVANCMLATKISFINEMANLCEALQADINDVRMGIGHDRRIGFQFLHPGVGYGGSCFPKDVRAMIALAEQKGLPAQMLRGVDQINEDQKHVLFHKLTEIFGKEMSGRTIAIWGLAFKPRTDDIREAPSLVLIDHLLKAGAKVRVHDPEARENVKEIYGSRLTYCDRAYGTLEGADALAIVTEWNEFRNPNFDVMKALLERPVIVDGRNLYELDQMRELGFTYHSIGRATVNPEGVS
ncbi:UDP-glucose 6-dehydrogenase [Planctomycetes bacterium Pan216]|uniref:UDP-glucose 6-dehydrogenase n=1 Tax=Kolteria novifilia TaxID=2527975 RepID=A0A518B8S1_9BACT|nr:UDP-glucose 6-dehydrogenase [Planctomycetes bacterium Pan216]